MMSIKLFRSCSAMVLALGLATTAQAGESNLPKCPIMGEPVNLAVSTKTDDGPVFFCCKGCIKKFEAEPGKYAKEVADQRKILSGREKVQVTCPVTNEPVDRDVHTMHNGQKVYFCCTGCLSKFKRDPAKYAKGLANSYTYQTRCPVMNGEVDPQSFTELAGGHKIYYCCQGCETGLLGEPEKYAKVLAKQGYRIAPQNIKKAGAEGDH